MNALVTYDLSSSPDHCQANPMTGQVMEFKHRFEQAKQHTFKHPYLLEVSLELGVISLITAVLTLLVWMVH